MDTLIPLTATRRIFAIGLACLSLMHGATTALAQDTGDEPTRAQVEKAKEHFANAKMHHDAKEYIAAADEYEQAYAVLPNAEFIFNAAQVFRLAGEKEEALKRYDKYLRLAPKGRAAADARMHRSNLKRAIAKTAGSTSSETSTRTNAGAESPVDPNAGTADTSTTASADTDTGSDTALTTIAEPARKADAGKTLRIAGIATGGVGVVALGVGLAYNIRAIDLQRKAETMFDRDTVAKGEAAEVKMFIFYGVGAAALATGTVMYILGRRSGASADSQASLTIGPTASSQDGAGFVLSGSF